MLETRAPAVPFVFACPVCRNRIADSTCANCNATYPCEDGIWRFLPPRRAQHYAQFAREYLTVRREEGWGSPDASYYRALPWQDLSGRFVQLWRIRAASFKALLREVQPQSSVVDIGAGNGWLAYQLSLRGHDVAAVDVQTDPTDGLGAYRHYDASFTPIQAEFEHLPLMSAQIDLAVFNGSFHYATTFETTLAEALRVLKPGGRVAILDSPVYSSDASGRQMLIERQTRFQKTYGFASDALPTEGYLTPDRLDKLASATRLHWRIVRPFHGWRRTLQPYWARLRGARQPASFPVILGTRV
jgi:SAM-dependent methyltransferase